MKFSSRILLAFSAFLALPINAINASLSNFDINLNNVNNKYEIVSITYEENADCIMSIDEYKECYGSNRKSISRDKLDEICDSYLTDKCQKFYRNGISKLNGCEALSEKVLLSYTLKYEYFDFTFGELCSKDESGDYCPLTKFLHTLQFTGKATKASLNRSINETCKSKKCVESTVKYLKLENEVNKKMKEFEDKMTSSHASKRQLKSSNNSSTTSEEDNNEIIEFLSSDQCKLQISATSDATTRIINNNLLLISISVLLYKFINY